MDITLSSVELATLASLHPDATPEEAIHLTLGPLVERASEARLQVLVDRYRQMDPDDQVEAVDVLKEWQRTKPAKGDKR